MPFEAGTRIASYEVVELLGAGGMGEVYRARDTKLKRDVALKVLPGEFASDADRLSRFEREAELLATLNHPNIAGIHGLEQADGTTAIVMELVDGETLEERIRHQPSAGLPIEETLSIARQIADALEAAHDRGVIHRDLKPANIKITPDGTVKVLDFGLAKMIEAGAGSADASSGRSFPPTLSVHATMAGVILGTAAYMSPEQARGKPVDRRTDIWAFGCVLFEMLAGRQTFEAGETVTDTIAAIIKNDPDWTALPADTPAHIRALLRRCLQKDARRRLPHIGVARLEIEEGASVGTPAPGAPVRPATRVLPWIATAVAVVVAGALAIVLLGHREPIDVGTIRLSLSAPEGATFGQSTAERGTGTPAPHFAPSPDGRRLAYVMYSGGTRPPQLWVHRLDAPTDQALPGTDDASFPFWSPDSRFIGFFTRDKLKKVDASGGPPQIICDAADGEGGTWNRDGDIVFGRDAATGLFRVSAAGGVPAALTTLDAARKQTSHRWPQFLPDGRHFLYLAMAGPVSPGGRVAAGPDGPVLYVGSLDAASPTLVMTGALRAQYAAGRLLFVKDGTLLSRAFDARSLRMSGDPVPIAQQVASNAFNARTAFAVSDGVLAYRNGGSVGGRTGLFVLAWFDRSGKRLESVGTAADYWAIGLSPDGKTAAANIGVPGTNSDLWTLDLTRGAIASRLTFTPEQVGAGVAWSPDGGRIAFAGGADRREIYLKPSSGVGEAELLFKSDRPMRPSSWSPDGRYLAFNETDTKGVTHVSFLSLVGDRKPTLFLEKTFDSGDAVFSPDGRWVAYTSSKGSQSGQEDVYVRAFPNGAREWRLSQAGGVKVQWRADGRELFYLEPISRELMAVEVKEGASLEPAPAVKLFNLVFLRNNGFAQYAVTPDGKRFLFIQPANVAETRFNVNPIVVEINWTARDTR
jgi:Tol biopolymer transport system component